MPSGRLTISFPYAAGQCPVYYNRYNSGRPAKDEYHSDRFSMRYVDGPSVPLYPFGYGLTYTNFHYGEIILSNQSLVSVKSMKRGEMLTARCMIKNTGNRVGTETAQLYLRDMSGSLVRPVRMLKGFERITLNPGEEKEVAFTIEEEMLKFHTLKDGFTAENGKFRVYIAENASVERFAEFELV